MAEKTEFLQAIDDAILDADSLERFINGDDTQDVLTRLSAEYPTLQKAIKELFENGGIADRFKTLADLQVSPLVDGDYALVADDTIDKNGIYIKEGGEWRKSKYDSVLTAVDKAVAESKLMLSKNLYTENTNILDAAVDLKDEVYRYTDKDGKLHLIGLDKSVQDKFIDVGNDIDDAKAKITDDNILAAYTDKNDDAFAYFDENSNLHISGDLYIDNNKQPIIRADELFQIRQQSILLSTIEPRNDLYHIAKRNDDYLTKRMPFGIKTPTGLLCVYHQQIDGYDGDSEGSQLWKAIIDVNADLSIEVKSKELFLEPDVPQGIVKHPTLGRKKDGTIILIYEKRNSNDELYQRYQCESTDEGVTFTAPRPVVFNNDNPAGNGKNNLGTTGGIIRAKNDRMIIPVFSLSGLQYCMYSDDEGETWTFSKALQIEGSAHEPAIVVDMNGDLFMSSRPNQQERRLQARSYDNGETWHLDTDYQHLRAVRNQGTMYADHSIGAIFHTHNDTPTQGDGSFTKTGYTWAISYDNGKTYPHSFMPFGYDWFGGYSQIIKWKEGIYILLSEGAPMPAWGNFSEGFVLNVISISEVLKNVSSN